MRCFPPPLRVTNPPPSSTTRLLVLTTLAVCRITIRTGRDPHRNLITPPLATARTTARDVQLARVPVPTHRSGCEVSTGLASGGTSTGDTAADAPGAENAHTMAAESVVRASDRDIDLA